MFILQVSPKIKTCRTFHHYAVQMLGPFAPLQFYWFPLPHVHDLGFCSPEKTIGVSRFWQLVLVTTCSTHHFRNSEKKWRVCLPLEQPFQKGSLWLPCHILPQSPLFKPLTFRPAMESCGFLLSHHLAWDAESLKAYTSSLFGGVGMQSLGTSTPLSFEHLNEAKPQKYPYPLS